MSGGFGFAPLVPWPLIAVLGGTAAALLAYGAARRARGTLWRALATAVLVLALANPRSVEEDRQPQADVAVVMVDDSPSQTVGQRKAQSEAALEAVLSGLARFADLDVRVVRAPGNGTEEGATHLFGALGRALAEVPSQRLAGAILITDGQVHDVPSDPGAASLPRPLHVLLTGDRHEMDRRLAIGRAPGYGIVGKPVTIAYRVEDRPTARARSAPRTTARVRLRRDGVEIDSAVVPVWRSAQFSIPLEHAGPTVVELEVEPAGDELSTLNNRAVVTVNGVRDRLRVLLISGQPHPGERTWRNLLKSDPSVDLVHFTILRPPEKDDMTPLRELALIVFPVHELFEVKLREFNLVIFDRYIIRDVLPPSYLRNIEAYVREGGALLMAVGPEFAGLRSLFRTPLGVVMPGAPTGQVIEQGFRPVITDMGRRHPVTDILPKGLSGKPRWGRWFRQIDAVARSGVVLMGGVENRPLLILDRVGKGRVAQVMSDHIWLWAREFEGGGPQAELLRRLAHWLMKEPELEEERLLARARGGQLTIERRSLAREIPPVTVTAPSGAVTTLTLVAGRDGRAGATVPAEETGLYRVDDGTRIALAAAGALDSPELSDLRATAEHLAPVVAETGGGIAWIAGDDIPELRRTRPGRDTAGRGWIGLIRNQAYVVTGVVQVSLLPGLLVLVLVLGGLTAAWWREGK